MSEKSKELSILIFSLHGGGLEKSILRLARVLSEQGIRVNLLVAKTSNAVYSVPDELNFVDLGASKVVFILFPLMRHIMKTKPRILFSAGTPLNTIAILSRLITGYPKHLVVGERNHLSSIVKYSSRLRDKFRPLFVRFLYSFADMVLAVSKSVAEDVIEVGRLNEGKVRVVHNFFDVDQIVTQATSPTDVGWIDHPNVPILVSVGRMVPQKGYDSLLKAFCLLRKQRECRLIILGDGKERASLENLAKELHISNDVYMPGFVLNPYAYIAKASLFVHSSLWDGLPGVLIEALACGTPIIATDSPGGASEILENGKYGTLVRSQDAAKLAEAMLIKLDKENDSEKLVERARFFSSQKILQEYMSVFGLT